MGETRSLHDLTPFPPHVYEGINLDWLVLYAVGAIDERKVDLSFEHVVVAAFRLFPKKFSLLAYPDYPDAKRVHDALWRCTLKNRQWVLGKTSQGFAFSERGRQELELARQALKRGPSLQKKTFSQTRRIEKLLAEVRAAPAYAKYSQGTPDKVSEAECCHVLQGTLDSERRILANNLTKLTGMADELGQKDVVVFMDWLGARFARFLERGEGHGKV